MQGSAQPENQLPSASAADATAGTDRSAATGAVGAVRATGDPPRGPRALEETELDSALQLLVERAQYITGATGAALALAQGEEMVCRASAGASAPAVGARLQVRSGLTGESLARRQLLRCDNAETDARVNLEACQVLGIASIVVLPLLRRNGEIRGLFELFSDHPYAFEERDLIALERMADLTLTALDLAERRRDSAGAPAPRREPETRAEVSAANGAPQDSAIPLSIPVSIPLNPESAAPAVVPREAPGEPPAEPPANPEPEPAAVPEAMLHVQRCASCGFPVSDGRTLCVDCDRKDAERERRDPRQDAESNFATDGATGSAAQMPEEFVPAFLRDSVAPKESWLGNHVNLLAIVVLVLCILVAVVVFR